LKIHAILVSALTDRDSLNISKLSILSIQYLKTIFKVFNVNVMLLSIVFNDMDIFIIFGAEATEAYSPLDVFVLREPTGSPTTTAWSMMHFDQIIILKPINGDFVLRMVSSMTFLAESNKFGILVFPRIKPVDVVHMMNLEKSFRSFLRPTTLAGIIVASKNPQTLCFPLSPVEQKGVRLLGLRIE
jgi:hypothetical protein